MGEQNKLNCLAVRGSKGKAKMAGERRGAAPTSSATSTVRPFAELEMLREHLAMLSAHASRSVMQRTCIACAAAAHFCADQGAWLCLQEWVVSLERTRCFGSVYRGCPGSLWRLRVTRESHSQPLTCTHAYRTFCSCCR